MTSRHGMKYLYCKGKSYMVSQQSKNTETLGSQAMPMGSMGVRPGGGSPGQCPRRGRGWVWAAAVGESAVFLSRCSRPADTTGSESETSPQSRGPGVSREAQARVSTAAVFSGATLRFQLPATQVRPEIVAMTGHPGHCRLMESLIP